MVVKTFACDDCKKEYDVEMDMNQKTYICPECKKEARRVFNLTIVRPGADSNGFYGIDSFEKKGK